MDLKRKILTGYGSVILLFAAVVLWAVFNMVSLGRETESILSENYRSIEASDNMIEALYNQNTLVFQAATGTLSDPQEALVRNNGEFHQWLGRAKDNVTILGEQAIVDRLDSLYHDFEVRLRPLVFDSYVSPADAELLYRLSGNIMNTCRELRALNENTMYSASNRTSRVADRAVLSTAIISAVVVLLSLMFSILLAGRILKPIQLFVAASQKISAGDYQVQVPVSGSDELAILAEEYNKMASKLAVYHNSNLEQLILEKKKSEAILRGMEDGLIILDKTLEITGINPAAKKMLGVGMDESPQKHVKRLLGTGILKKLLDETLSKGSAPDYPEEKRVIPVGHSKRQKYLLFSISAINNEKGLLLGVIILLRDVTRIRKTEQMKDDFLMSASHELKTPLTSLGMSVDLLSEEVSQGASQEVKALLEAAGEEVERMKNLVNDLLDMSKIEAGWIEMEFTPVDIDMLFEKSVQVFKTQSEERGVELKSIPSKGIPKVLADPNKVTWILTNLISNSLRYVEKGGKIELSAKKSGSHVYISVADNGAGIPMEYQTKIFDKFVQVNPQEPGGTGLGLAICKEIVKAHKGTIWVDSSVGEGSTFTFTLPIASKEQR